MLFGGGEKATEHLNLSSTVFFLRPLDFVLGVDINSPTLEVFVIAPSLQVSQLPESGRLLFVVVLSINYSHARVIQWRPA